MAHVCKAQRRVEECSPRLEQVRPVHYLRQIRVDTELKRPCVPQLVIQPQLGVDGPLKSIGSALLEQLRHRFLVTIMFPVEVRGMLRVQANAMLLVPKSGNGMPPPCPAEETTSHYSVAPSRL